jgi:hypothetical protein
MSNYILTYFFIGVIFTFLMDLLIDHLCRFDEPSFAHTMEWDNSQRILCTILWPLGMVWFFVAFFKSWFN